MCFAVVLLLAVAFAASAAAQDSIFSIQSSPNPNIHANTLTAVTALSPTDAWAVGYQNSNNLNFSKTLTMHWDGTRWRVVPSPNPGSPPRCRNFNSGNVLNAVAAIAPNDVWAVGLSFTCDALLKPMALHWDGTRWRVVPTPPLNTNDNAAFYGIVALASDNVYAVGYHPAPNGAVLTLVEHWDGTAWSVISSPNLSPTGSLFLSVSANSPTDIWAAGLSVDAPTTSIQTLIEHFDGNTWTIVPSPNPLPKAFLNQNVLTSVLAVSPTDITAVGYLLDSVGQRKLTLVEHWDGAKWSVIPSPNHSENIGSLNTLTGVTAVSANDLYAVGFFADFTTAGQHETLVEHWDGLAWTIIPSPTRGLAQQLNGAFALPGTSDVWVVGAASRFGISFDTGFLQVPVTLVLFSPIG